MTSVVSPEPSDSPSDPGPPETWWNRACGGREVIALALPLMISTLSYSLMQFCDRVFLAWHSSTSLAAVMPSGVMAWTLLSFPFGVALYTSVFVAQYHGANQDKRIGSVVVHGAVMALLFCPLFIASAIWPDFIFQLAGHPDDVAREEAIYFRYVSIGSIAQVLGGVLTSFFIGLGRTRTVMVVDVSVAIVNVLLDALLIFGCTYQGTTMVPSMGIQGAAIATSFALWVKAILFLVLILNRNHRARFGITRKIRFQPLLLLRMVKFGSSNGLQFLIECLGFSIFTLMVGRLGEVSAAATTVAISVSSMVFVPIWGLSMAVSTLVGQQIGNGKPDLAARATWTSLFIGLIYTGTFGLLYFLTPEIFLIGHSSGAENFEQISELAQYLLMFVAAYCLFDAGQIVFAGAIKGAGDTTYVVIVTFFCSLSFVGVGLLGYQWSLTDQGLLYWWWSCLTGWICLLLFAFGSRFLAGQWKSMTVIERDLTGLVAPAEPESE